MSKKKKAEAKATLDHQAAREASLANLTQAIAHVQSTPPARLPS